MRRVPYPWPVLPRVGSFGLLFARSYPRRSYLFDVWGCFGGAGLSRAAGTLIELSSRGSARERQRLSATRDLGLAGGNQDSSRLRAARSDSPSGFRRWCGIESQTCPHAWGTRRNYDWPRLPFWRACNSRAQSWQTAISPECGRVPGDLVRGAFLRGGKFHVLPLMSLGAGLN